MSLPSPVFLGEIHPFPRQAESSLRQRLPLMRLSSFSSVLSNIWAWPVSNSHVRPLPVSKTHIPLQNPLQWCQILLEKDFRFVLCKVWMVIWANMGNMPLSLALPMGGSFLLSLGKGTWRVLIMIIFIKYWNHNRNIYTEITRKQAHTGLRTLMYPYVENSMCFFQDCYFMTK